VRLLVAVASVLACAEPKPPSVPETVQARATGGGLRLAITVDDLPWNGAPPPVESPAAGLQRIANTLRRNATPATGFVICEPERQTPSAQRWVDAGLELGNHSDRHRDLNATPVSEWLADVRRCDLALRAHGPACKPFFRPQAKTG
jgi:peptidoglycan/xylan/chitin deacetylase (PgdA/CDA1 family)